MNSTLFNNSGLILNILGVLILFKYGLPSFIHKYSKNIVYSKTITKNEGKELLLSYFLAWVGMILIVLGFVFQIIANNF
tara:strand:+ start:5060 stop:5296 length:237 start_codon:yes stop_codon:yes gene_type:complete